MNTAKRTYLDYAAATPLLPEAKVAMLPYLDTEFGNPSAIHQEGVKARSAVEMARTQIARAVEVKPEYVTFTSGGTEANNIALFGTIEALRQSGRSIEEMEVITTLIEHPSVYRAMHRLEQMGVMVKYVDVDEVGKISFPSLKSQLSAKTVLVSVAYINSEIGTIQPLHALKKAIAEAEKKHSTSILLHLDAAQAPLWASCQLGATFADVLTLDFGKCGGPKGVGVLVRSRRANVAPTVFGGGQEAGLRPGTENVAGIVGAGVAFSIAQTGWRERAEQVRFIRNQAFQLISETLPQAIINGTQDEYRVANNINISLPGIDTEYLTIVLDTAGFAVSTKSACSGAGGGESTVVREISNDPARATSTLRITLGPNTTFDEVKVLTETIAHHLKTLVV